MKSASSGLVHLGLGVLALAMVAPSAQAAPATLSVGAALHGDLRVANPTKGLDGEDYTGELESISSSGSAGIGVGLSVPVRIHLGDMVAVRLETSGDYTRGDMAMVVRQGAPIAWGGATTTATGDPPAWQTERAFLISASGALISERLGAEMMLLPSAPATPYLHGSLGLGMLVMWPRSAWADAPLSDYYQDPNGAQVTGDFACSVREDCTRNGFGEVKVVTPTALVSVGAGVAALDRQLRFEISYTRGRAGALHLNGAGGEPNQTKPYALGQAFQLVQLSAGVAFGG